MEAEKEKEDKAGGQNVVSEGPILISTTEVKGDFVMGQLRNTILEAIGKGQLTNEAGTRVLILSGSHGDGGTGHSGLTDIGKLREVVFAKSSFENLKHT